MIWQCFSCDQKSKSKDDLQDCIKQGHRVEKMLDEGELIQVSLEHQDKKIPDNHVFTIDKEKHTEIKSILTRKFDTIRPQTLLHDDKETRMILVYLPTKKEITKGQRDNQSNTIVFENSAYFVVCNPKEEMLSKKKVSIQFK